MKTNRKDKKWMKNPDQLKTPKLYNFQAIRLPDGTFHLLGGEQRVLVKKNQYSASWVNVDTRDIACELRRSKILSL